MVSTPSVVLSKGYPSQPQGVPHAWLGSTPMWGSPCPDLAGVPHPWGYPIHREGNLGLGYPMDLRPVTGVPHPRKDMGTVEVLWDGGGYPPWKGHGTSGSIMGWRWGTLPGCGQTDACENSTFPSYYVRGSKNKYECTVTNLNIPRVYSCVRLAGSR